MAGAALGSLVGGPRGRHRGHEHRVCSARRHVLVPVGRLLPTGHLDKHISPATLSLKTDSGRDGVM